MHGCIFKCSLLLDNSFLATERNADLLNIGHTGSDQLRIVFLFVDLAECFTGQSIQIGLVVIGEFEFVDISRHCLCVGNQGNIKSAEAGFPVGLDLIAVAHDGTQSKHHAVVEAFICAVQGSNGFQHVFFKQALQLFCVSGEDRLLNSDGRPILLRSVKNLFFVDIGYSEITYDRLIGKLEAECNTFIRQELLHKQTPIGEVSRKLGMMLTILSVIREPGAYADLPQDKVEQLYYTEGILDILCSMCSSVSEADLYEIADIIASAPSFVQAFAEQMVEEKDSTGEYYYGFTHFQRMKYNDIPHPESVDEITFGLYCRDGGCASEASVLWTHLDGKIVPYIRIFDDGIKAAFSAKFLAVVDKLRNMGNYTPGQLSYLLIDQGFEDNSDTPLEQLENVKYLRLPRREIMGYEALMSLPKGHSDLEAYPRYALIKSWTKRFDNPLYEMEIKVCSSDHGDPLWCEAVLFKDGQQVAYSEPEAELAGDWTLLDNGAEFTVYVIPEGTLLSSEKYRGRIRHLKNKARRIGANLEHSFFDDKHLDCFWYDGKDYATIEYKGYTICFDVCGEVQATIICDKEINEEGFIEISHKNGEEPLFFRSDLKKVLDNDTALNLYRLMSGTEIEAQNWVNVNIKCQATGEYVCEPAASDYSSLLDAVENAFDSYIKYIDDMLADMGDK